MKRGLHVNLPIEFSDRMKGLLGDEFDTFAAQYDLPHSRGLRINTLKMSITAAYKLGFTLEEVPFAKEGFKVLSDEKSGSSPYHHAGAFYSQEPSAMSAVTALDPQKGEFILDMCAAPGGKTTQIAARLGGDGCIWSNEYVRSRANILISNIERCGIRNAVVTSMRPDALAAKTGAVFDRVLVDAPCSGEGMFRKEENAVRDWSPENVAACAVRQAEILDSAALCLKNGGVLVYSTCTFAPEEDEKNIIAFLDRHPEFSLEEIPVRFGRSGLDISDRYDLTLTRRIYPQDGGEGHFVARLRKSGELTESKCFSPAIKENAQIKMLRETYESCFKDIPQGTFAVYVNNGYLLPPQMPDVPLDGVIRAGIPVGEIKNNRIEPAHGLFMAARMEDCRRYIDLSPDSPELSAFLHGEEISCDGDNGFTAVCCDGIVTGFGKVSGGKLKNRYPKGLRTLR